MDRPCHQLFAGAALTLDQDRRVCLGGVLDELDHASHLRALADDLLAVEDLVDPLSELHVFFLQPALLDCTLDQVAQLVRVDRFGDVIECSVFERLHGRLDRREGRDHDDGDARIDVVDAFLQLHPVHARHSDVEQGDIERVRFEVTERLQRGGRRRHLVAVLLEPMEQRVSHRELVVDHHDPRVLAIHAGFRPGASIPYRT
jgi:hypothetical protein